MTSAFRHHTQPPARVASPLYRQLINEWVQLNQLKSSQLALRQWGRLEPALTGHHSPADLVDTIDQATSVAEDAMLVALIRLAQNGLGEIPRQSTMRLAFKGGLIDQTVIGRGGKDLGHIGQVWLAGFTRARGQFIRQRVNRDFPAPA